jgi:hypothetical protein
MCCKAEIMMRLKTNFVISAGLGKTRGFIKKPDRQVLSIK